MADTVTLPVPLVKELVTTMQKLASKAFTKSAAKNDKQLAVKAAEVTDMLIKSGAIANSDRGETITSLMSHQNALAMLSKVAAKIEPRSFGTVVANTNKTSSSKSDVDRSYLTDLGLGHPVN